MRRGEWELFDLRTERTEQHDLADDNPGEAAAMENQRRKWARDSNLLPKSAPKPKK